MVWNTDQRPSVLHVLDEPLSPEERTFAEQTLRGPWARFKTGVTAIEERRVEAHELATHGR